MSFIIRVIIMVITAEKIEKPAINGRFISIA